MKENNPGCYGLPSTVSASCRSCCLCPVRGGCAFEASELLESMPESPLTQRTRLALSLTRQAFTSVPQPGRGSVSQPVVVASPGGIRRIALSQEQLADLATLPPRVAKQVKTLKERGWFRFAKAELVAGRNPADKGWKRVLCHLLLTGGGTRASLELAYCEQLAMTPGSARMQVSAGLAVFAAGRLATVQFGRIELLPN